MSFFYGLTRERKTFGFIPEKVRKKKRKEIEYSIFANGYQIVNLMLLSLMSNTFFGIISAHFVLQFVVGLGDKVSPTDIEEGMRVG